MASFKPNHYAYRTIEASGTYSGYTDRYEINPSSVLDALIIQAGKDCEHYASDLFIYWSGVSASIERGESGVYYFGFHRNGVDCESLIDDRLSGTSVPANYVYRSMYILTVSVENRDVRVALDRAF